MTLSLATRVSLFFLATLAVVLAGFSATLFMLASAHFHRDLDERLMIGLDSLAASIGVLGQPQSTPRMPAPDTETHPGEAPLSWAVFDPQGKEFEFSQDGSLEGLRGAFRHTPVIGHVHLSVTAPDGKRWRLTSRRLGKYHLKGKGEEEDKEPGHATVAAHGRGPVVVTGTLLAPSEAALRNLGLTLVGISSGLWIVAAVVGHRLCRKALAPVSAMAAAAREMNATDLDGRLPGPGTGDELEDLAGSFNGLLGRLHEALDRQGRFTGDASHQLRTPLTALISEIELARRRERTTEEYVRVLDVVHGDASRLRQIVEALLFLARADTESESPTLERVNLGSWLPDHLRHWERHERACDLRLENATNHPTAWARVHPALLGQLVDNLLDNACKYSDSGSPVVVRLDHQAGGRVALAVEDHGAGIAPADLPHVFDPFFRSPSARLGGQPGVGLGLAVAQRIASSFGGRIEAESTPGRGSRFIASFPEVSGPA